MTDVLDQETIELVNQTMHDTFLRVRLDATTGRSVVAVASSVFGKCGHAVEAHEIITTQNPMLAGSGSQYTLVVGIWAPTAIVGGPWHVIFRGG